jgi:glutamate-1-semialdehyde 2,1-aminomutase
MPRALTRSRQLQLRAEKFLPGGVDSPVRAFRAVGGDPPFVTHAEGAWIFDADGNRNLESWREADLSPVLLRH